MYERRDVHKFIAQLPAVGLPLAMVLANPSLARAAAEGLEIVAITTPGGAHVSAALAVPAQAPAPALVLVHEWWSLNDQIKSVAAEFAAQGYVAMAINLYGGNVATTWDDAMAYMQAVDGDAATDTAGTWVDWLRARSDVTGKIGTVGGCFGGGW